MSELVFALDIGTQSVTGILLKQNQANYEVIDYCVRHHEQRAMLDGQIQDIVEVAHIISDVKSELEKNNGPLKEVCVAAAGRALKTIQTTISTPIAGNPLPNKEAVAHFELSAVQKAQTELMAQQTKDHLPYHCVGYSVLHYYVDDEKITSLIDQAGEDASVDIIATFLPKIVIESLAAALDRAGLIMKALTLEPIAAIQLLVPPSMQRLNVALIDIGAGTSDIAIAKEGTVSAYGMVPQAGDEMTETLSDAYLLDFKVAEQAKQDVVLHRQTTVKDALGFDSDIDYDTLVQVITPTVEKLAETLGEEIFRLNGKAPQAVMLIGGGSLTPSITEKLATFLQLPANRTAVRGMEAVPFLNQENKAKLPSGPEFITPVGIAIRASEQPIHYTTVYINDKKVMLFQLHTLTVADCLIQTGIDIHDYYGKMGLAAIVTVNGKPITLRGNLGEPPALILNGEPASVQSTIQSGDRITLRKGKDGKRPETTVTELGTRTAAMQLHFQGIAYSIQTEYIVNEKIVSADYVVQDKDVIQIDIPKTIADFLRQQKTPVPAEQWSCKVIVNQRPITLEQAGQQILLNGQFATTMSPVQDGDEISFQEETPVTISNLLSQLQKSLQRTITVTFEGEKVELVKQRIHMMRGDEVLNGDTIVHANDELKMTELAQTAFIFQDVFRYVDLDTKNKRGYQLYRNGNIVSFHDEIHEGDELSIKWEST